MAEPTKTEPKTPEPGSKGDDPGTKPNTETTSSDFDVSKLSDKDLDKVLEDQRLWKKPAIKELVETRKTLREREKADAEAQEQQLAKEKKWEELAQKAQTEREALQKQYQQTLINNEIIKEAAKHGPQDIDAVTKLIDSSNIQVGDDGKVTGVAEAITQLQESKPYLFGKTKPKTIGEPSNPSDPDNGEMTLSKISDPAYYQKNRDTILKNVGKIRNDRSQGR